uniref:Peptidase S1 domain-containing protein n=1 Tax=Hucho hucho TaxID=62062 RepID=A0A4W5JR35_9TELE
MDCHGSLRNFHYAHLFPLISTCISVPFGFPLGCRLLLQCPLVRVSDAITGGREAEAHSRPYMASLQVADGCKMKHECGGFLVTDQWMMSAAHCFLSG